MKGNFVQQLFNISVMKTIWKFKKQFVEIQDTIVIFELKEGLYHDSSLYKDYKVWLKPPESVFLPTAKYLPEPN